MPDPGVRNMPRKRPVKTARPARPAKPARNVGKKGHGRTATKKPATKKPATKKPAAKKRKPNLVTSSRALTQVAVRKGAKPAGTSAHKAKRVASAGVRKVVKDAKKTPKTVVKQVKAGGSYAASLNKRTGQGIIDAGKTLGDSFRIVYNHDVKPLVRKARSVEDPRKKLAKKVAKKVAKPVAKKLPKPTVKKVAKKAVKGTKAIGRLKRGW